MRWAASLALLLATVARAQPPPPLPSAGPLLILRLDGVLERTREPAAAVGSAFTVVSLQLLGEPDDRRYLAVERARTVGGDHPLLGKDVLAALAPFDPNLLVAGSTELVQKLRALPPGRVRLEGLVDRGSRVYQLREVRTPPGDD